VLVHELDRDVRAELVDLPVRVAEPRERHDHESGA
jgi:hypothetical protein